MFLNIYPKRILGSLRNLEITVWTWIFPFFLSTLFYFAFTNLGASYQFRQIPLGVVDSDAFRQNAAFVAALEAVSGEGETQMFELMLLAGPQEADDLLELGDIDGYIIVDGLPKLIVTGSGLNQTIAKGFLDRYIQTESLVTELLFGASESSAAASSGDDRITSGDLAALLTPVSYTQEASLTSSRHSDSVSYFFALLAMVCLYGGFQGMISVAELQANLSPVGARKTMSPAGRFRMVTYDLLGALTIQFICLTTVIAYINLVLGVSFGSQLWLVLLTCLAGSLLGLSFGAMVSVTSKLKEQAKTAILIAVSMVLCFLSGLMVGGINYTVAQSAPVVAWLNPAARIADAFYCLYYYETYERYFLNIGIILGMAVVMLGVTAVFLRRQRYESI